MVVELYHIESEANRLTKSLGTALEKSAVLLKDSTDIVNPTIQLAYDSQLFNKNYAYIEEFGRYYFITGIDISNHIVYIHLHVDVLMTYRSDIRASRGRIVRSNVGNLYIPDGLATQTNKTNWQWRKLGTCFIPSDDYIMIKGGKR